MYYLLSCLWTRNCVGVICIFIFNFLSLENQTELYPPIKQKSFLCYLSACARCPGFVTELSSDTKLKIQNWKFDVNFEKIVLRENSIMMQYIYNYAQFISYNSNADHIICDHGQ